MATPHNVLRADIIKILEETHMTASASFDANTNTLHFSVLEDGYEFDYRPYGDLVALDGVLMIPDAELIANRVLATRNES